MLTLHRIMPFTMRATIFARTSAATPPTKQQSRTLSGLRGHCFVLARHVATFSSVPKVRDAPNQSDGSHGKGDLRDRSNEAVDVVYENG